MKVIYKPKGKAGEYAQYAVNFYTGCSNGCDYCYCKRGVLKSVWADKPRLKSCFKDEDAAYAAFRLDVDKHIVELRQHDLFFSFTTDPCLPETVNLTRCAVSYAVYKEIPVQILTKMASEELLIGLEYYANWVNSPLPSIAVGFTLTGHDELESNASTNLERIAMMRRIHELGFKTFASIEPVIDVEHSEEMVCRTEDCCDLFKVGLRSGVLKAYYDDGKLREFIDHLALYESKFYLKDSYMERLCIDRFTLPSNFVNSDYDIFKDN